MLCAKNSKEFLYSCLVINFSLFFLFVYEVIFGYILAGVALLVGPYKLNPKPHELFLADRVSYPRVSYLNQWRTNTLFVGFLLLIRAVT